MEFLDLFASQTSFNSANPFALFSVAQLPRESSNAYRVAAAYSSTEFGVLVRAIRASTEGMTRRANKSLANYKSHYITPKSGRRPTHNAHNQEGGQEAKQNTQAIHPVTQPPIDPFRFFFK